MKLTYFIPTVFFSISSFFLGGVFFSEYVDSFRIDQQIFESEGVSLNTARLNDAYSIVESQYLHVDELEKEALVDGAIRGMLGALDDPYTAYFDEKEYKDFNNALSGTFEGIGAEIGVSDKQLTVVSPLPGTPAEQAGLVAGDKILFIDGKDTEGMPVEKAVTLIRGEKGTQVTLTINRDSALQEIVIERGVIRVPEVKVSKVADGVVQAQVYQFGTDTIDDLSSQLENYQLQEEPIKGIILDLRGNPGGYLEQAVNMVGLFVDIGSVAVSEKFRDGKTQDLKTQQRPKFPDVSVVVLVNEGSASASEIVAGALRDLEGAVIVGKTSFGKGSVQKLEQLKNGGAIKVTIAEWLTPKGTVIQESGITPDFEIERTAEDNENQLDPQLDRAVEVIQDQISQ
jgi:carboxyl-terminal processing protease